MVYAAGIAGSAVDAGVLGALDSDDASVRRVAAGAAGEARLASPVAVEALFRCLEDDVDDLVRSNAAYALGNIARVRGANVSAKRLLARLDPAVEPDNTANGGMSRSTVRVSVAYALCNMALGDSDLAALASAGLADHDRYVRGLSAAVLERHAQFRAEPWLRTFVGTPCTGTVQRSPAAPASRLERRAYQRTQSRGQGCRQAPQPATSRP